MLKQILMHAELKIRNAEQINKGTNTIINNQCLFYLNFHLLRPTNIRVKSKNNTLERNQKRTYVCLMFRSSNNNKTEPPQH